ncbi:MAG: metallophosphoesterase, partial [Candidatus Nanohaloarchaea archaeon]
MVNVPALAAGYALTVDTGMDSSEVLVSTEETDLHRDTAASRYDGSADSIEDIAPSNAWKDGGEPSRSASPGGYDGNRDVPDDAVVVTFSDIHGYYDQLDGALQAAEQYLQDEGIISDPIVREEPDHLTPGEALENVEVYVVANGDMFDRGRENEKVMKSMLAMVGEAPENVAWTLGNHDTFIARPVARSWMDPDHMADRKVYWWTMDEEYRERFLDHMAEGNIVAGVRSHNGYTIQHASTPDMDIDGLNADLETAGAALRGAHGTDDWKDVQRAVGNGDSPYDVDSDLFAEGGVTWTRMPENDDIADQRLMVGHDQVTSVKGEKNSASRKFPDRWRIEDSHGLGPDGWYTGGDNPYPPIRRGDTVNMNANRPNGRRGLDHGGVAVLHHPDKLPDGDIVAVQDMGGDYRTMPMEDLPHVDEMGAHPDDI